MYYFFYVEILCEQIVESVCERVLEGIICRIHTYILFIYFIIIIA